MDIEATCQFLEKYNRNLSIKFPIWTLTDIVQECKRNKNLLIIFLHNDNDVFSTEFSNAVTQDFVDNSNFIVWDIDEQCGSSLIKICNLHLNCDLLTDYISYHKSALFVFKLVREAFELKAFYDGDIKGDVIISKIYEDIFPVEAMDSSTSYESKNQPVDNIDLQNLTLRKALMQFGLVIEDDLQTAIETSISTIRPLIIYIHNGEDIFSKLIWPLFTNKDVNDLFNYYTIYAWDLNNAYENLRFASCAQKYRTISYIQKRIQNKMSCLFTFSSVSGEIKMNTIFDGCIYQEDFLFELYNIHMVHSEEKLLKFTLIQKEAILTATTDIESKFDFDDLPISYSTIEETMKSTILSEPEYLQKMIVLFYYNENDSFSKKFLGLLLSKPKLRNVLQDLFVIIPWNIGISSYGTALKSVVRNNFNLDIMETCIDQQQGAVFVFTSVKNRPQLVYEKHGYCSSDDLINAFFEMSLVFQECKNITDIVEKSACQNFIECNQTLPKCYRTEADLHTAIKENCFCTPIKKRKMLMLYFHNITNKGCQDFTNTVLRDPKIEEMIRNEYVFVPWEVSVSPYKKEKLCLALKRYFALEKMELLLRSNKPGVFIFMPIADTLALYSYVEGTEKQISKSDFLKKVKESSEFLNAEKSTEAMLNEVDTTTGPVQFQQLMYNQLGDRDYDCFELNNTGMESLLKKKLSFGLFGPPAAEEDEMPAKDKKRQDNKVNGLYDKVLEQVNKFAESNDMVVVTCIFNVLIPLPKTKLDRMKKEPEYNPSLDFVPLPVFVLRKCVNCPEGSTPCRIFIDHDLRVYQSWDLYLEGNKLPKGIFIAPKDGRYQGDHFGNVRIEYKMSPMCHIGKDILKYIDIGSTAAGAVAGIIGLASLVPAVTFAPAILIGAGVTGIGVGIYSVVRSSVTLHDRFCHDESMSPADSQARGAYLNIIAGSLSFGGIGASLMLSYFVRNGATVGLVVRSTVNGINGINVVTSGVAVANSAFDVLYNYVTDDEVPSALTMLQLSSSILFFGHAVYSFKTADCLINEAQYRSMQEIEASLRSNRHRKTFAKLTKETIRISGDVQKGQADVISYMKELNNKDEVLASLTRSNKDFNNNGIRFSVQDGQLNFNGKFVDISEFSNMSNMQRSEYMLNLPPMQESTPIQYKNVQSIMQAEFSQFNIDIPSAVLNTANFFMKAKDLSNMTNIFSEYVEGRLYMILKQFLERIFTDINLRSNLLNMFPGARIPVEAMRILIKFFKSTVLQDEERSAHDGVTEEGFNMRTTITRVVYFMEKAIILASLSMETTLRELIRFTLQYLCREIYERSNTMNRERVSVGKRETTCDVCKGFYYVV